MTGSPVVCLIYGTDWLHNVLFPILLINVLSLYWQLQRNEIELRSHSGKSTACVCSRIPNS